MNKTQYYVTSPNQSKPEKYTFPFKPFSLAGITILPATGKTQSENVGINTTTPIAGLHVVSDNGILVTGDHGEGIVPASGYGSRMMFSPKTSSFRVGRLTDEDGGAYENWWNLSNMGDYSFASGVNTLGSGYASFSAGHKTQATGVTSFAAGGRLNNASGDFSFAAGINNTAPSYGEFVIGTNALQYTPEGITGFDPDDRILVVGNGPNPATRSNALTILKNGNTGIGISSPLARLHIAGNTIIEDSLSTTAFRMTGGSGINKLLQSDANGNGLWVDPSALFSDDWSTSGNNIYNTNTGNIGIGTATPATKLHVAGGISIDNGKLIFLNTGGSVFIGESAGESDDLSNNFNVYIGKFAGQNGTNGVGNVGIGNEALIQAGTSSTNTAVGDKSLAGALTGGENAAFGAEALRNNTSGSSNLASGTYALLNNTTGSQNTATGQGALLYNTSGNQNVAVGSSALWANVSGSENVAVGRKAGGANGSGSNTFLGFQSGMLSSGSNNVFLGYKSGLNETGNNKLYIENSDSATPLIYGDFSTNKVSIHDSLTSKYFQMTNGGDAGKILQSDANGNGSWVDPSTVFSDDWTADGNNIYNTNTSNVGIGTNSPGEKLTIAGNVSVLNGRLQINNGGYGTMIGYNAGINDVVANQTASTFIGYETGTNNTTGGENTGIGAFALHDNVNGNFNVAVGNGALDSNISGVYNTGIGYGALGANTSGFGNVALGIWSLQNSTGNSNTAIGMEAGAGNLSGHDNTFVGHQAGLNNTGSYNVFLGKFAGKNISGDNKLAIDNSDTTTPLIEGDFSTNKVTIHDSLASTYLQMTDGAIPGHVLVSDDSGNAAWTDPQLLSSSYWSATGNNIYRQSFVGINTNNPISALHTVGDINIETGRLLFTLTNESVLIGTDAGFNNAGSDNVFIGNNTAYANTSGSNNIGLGANALTSNLTGNDNIAIGRHAMNVCSNGVGNIAVGSFALYQNNAYANVAVGGHSLELNSTGEENVSIGDMAGYNAQGDGNTFLGYAAGNQTEGEGNVFLGRNAGYNETGSNKLYISNSNTSQPLLYGDFDTKQLTIYDSLSTKMYKVNAGRIEFENTGHSIFIGDDAGKNDDLTTNNNVFIGFQAGKSNTTGTNNIAIGTHALENAPDTYYNIALGQDVLGNAGLTGNNNTGIGNFSLNHNTSGNENTAIGQSVLSQNNSGTRNVSVGNYSMDAMTTGSYNTAMGYEALGENILGENNAAFGYYAGNFNTGSRNTFLGSNAGLLNESGSGNIFLGNDAGFNETGNDKLYIDNTGTSAPLIYGDFFTNKVIINDSLATKYFQLTDGASSNYVLKSDNTGRGSWAESSLLFHNTSTDNLFIGDEVGDVITTASDNTMVGPYAGVDLTSGYENTALGKWSLLNITSGTFNTAIGHNTLANMSTATYNTALGWSALSGTSGSYNTALGGVPAVKNTSGTRNTFVGYNAGFNNQGSDNIFIGHKAGEDETGSNKLYIDNTDTATPLIAGNFLTNEVTINDSLTVNKELSVGTSIAKSTLEVNGSVAAKFKTPLVAGTTNPDDSGMVWRYSSGTGLITLPAASTCANRMYVIINQTGTPRTITQYRDLTTTPQTTLGSSVALWLMSDGTEWWQIK